MEFYTVVEQWGNSILYRGVKNGKRVKEKIEYKPTAFIETKEPSEWKTIKGKNAKPVEFESIKELKAFYERYEDTHGIEIHGIGPRKSKNAYLWEKFPNDLKFDPTQVRVMYFDIETHATEDGAGFIRPEDATAPVVTIACHIDDHTTVFGLKPYKHKANETYHHCTSERDLLLRFIEYWQHSEIDCMSGWNIKTYDVPYLVNRITKMIGEDFAKRLSPWNSIMKQTVEISGKDVQHWKLYGIDCMDYLEVFKKFGSQVYGTQESYKLDFIAELVLGDKKLDYTDYGNLRKLYEENPQLHTEYCVQDTLLVKRMDDKLKYMATSYNIAFSTRSSFPDTMGTVASWDSYLYGELFKKKICVPSEKHLESSGVDGAYVKEVVPGKYEWIVVLDFASLYPKCMIQYNISPETISDQRLQASALSLLESTPEIPSGLCLTGAGQLFRTDTRGIIPELVEALFNERKRIKRGMLDKTQEMNDLLNQLKSFDTQHDGSS